MIPIYPVPLPVASTPAVQGSKLSVVLYYLLRQLWRRTGGEGGIGNSVGSNLTATGNSQATALALSNDYNEVLQGAGGGAVLAALQPGQRQWVFNGSGGNVSFYPPLAGQIDANAVNAPYVLATGKTQHFQCVKLLASGGRFFRSLQLG